MFMGFPLGFIRFSGCFLGFLVFLGVFGIFLGFSRKVHGIFLSNLPLEKSCFPCSNILQDYTGGNVFSVGLRINPTPPSVMVKS